MSAPANIVSLFQDFKRIYGFCPCCGEPFRLSEVTLFHKTAPPRTLWDELEAARGRLDRAALKLEADIDGLRERAQEAGRHEMERRLRALTTFFRRSDIALRDLRLLFHPVDYVVFRGLSEGNCTAVEFLDCEPTSSAHERLQRSIEATINAGDYSWITMRIADNGDVTCS